MKSKKQSNDEVAQILDEIREYQSLGVKIYSVVGEFIFGFQDVCYAIKICLYKGLGNKGLSDIELSQNIVEHNSASQLASCLISFYVNFNKNDTNGQKIIKKLMNRFLKICEIRNDIVHGDLHVCYVGSDKAKVAYLSGQRLKATSLGISNSFKENHLDGKKYNIGYYNENYFKNLVYELVQIRAYCSYIGLYMEKGLDIGSNLNDSSYISWVKFNEERKLYLDNI